MPDRRKAVVLLMPVFVLLVTRAGIEMSVSLLPLRFSWIPSFGVYYASIMFCLYYGRRKMRLRIDYGSLSRSSFPRMKLFIIGIVVPAIIPLWMFVINVKAVPALCLVLIVAFALINPFFEESFWRGLMDKLPGGGVFRILYSSVLFSFSHYFLWGVYWLQPSPKWIAAVVSTFIMGILWMWFYQRSRNLVYPILSHVLVDVFNLSVVMFYGMKLVTV